MVKMIRIFTGCNQFELVIFIIIMCSIHCVSSSIQTRVPVYKLKFEFRAKIFELNLFDIYKYSFDTKSRAFDKFLLNCVCN